MNPLAMYSPEDADRIRYSFAPARSPDDGKPAALANLRANSGMTPDQAARDAHLGRELNMPSDMVSMNRADAETEKRERTINGLDNSALVAWLGNPYHTDISADDLEELDSFYKELTPQKAMEGLASFAKAIPHFGADAMHAVSRSVDNLGRGIVQAGRNIGEDWQFAQESHQLSEFANQAVENPALLPELQRRMANPPKERTTDGLFDLLAHKTFSGGLPFLYGMGRDYAEGGAYGAAAATAMGLIGPQSALPAVGALDLLLIHAAGTARMAEGLRRQSTGNLYMQLLQARDAYGIELDDDVIRNMATAGGAADALLQTGWGGLLGKSLEPAKKLLMGEALKRAVQAPTVVGALKEYGKEYAAHAASAVGLGVGSTAIGTGTERGAQEWSAYKTGSNAGDQDWLEKLPEKIAHSAADIMMSFGLIMAAGPLVKLRANLAEAARGAGNHDLMARAVDAAERSKTRERDPAAFENYAQSVLSEDMRRQYVDAERMRTFFQEAFPDGHEAALERMGIDETEFAVALENNSSVSLDTAKFLSHLTPEQQRQLLPDLKQSPLDLSRRETATRDFDAEVRKMLDDYSSDLGMAERYAPEERRLVDDMVAAGADRTQAEADARILTAMAATAEKRGWVTDGTARLRDLGFQGEGGTLAVAGEALNQAMRAGLDPDKRLPVVAAEKESLPVWESMKRGKKGIVQSIAGMLHNEATGIDIELSATNAKHMISSASKRGVGGEAHIAAVRKIKELMRVAEPIESYPDKKGQQDVKNIHRFFAPMHYDGELHAVNMTVKEHGGVRRIELESVHKLYDLKLEEKTPAGLADGLPTGGRQGIGPQSGASGISLREMLSGVKDSEGNSYFQSARGAVSFADDGRAIITLFKGRDASTVMHEAGHIFLRDMERMALAEDAPASLQRDFAVVRDYLGRFDDDISLNAEYDQRLKKQYFDGADFESLSPEQREDARAKAKHEYFARSFEAYLREGVAPSFELARVFQQFRDWLVKLYTNIRSLGVELTPEMRGVFDRMLASDEQLAHVEAVTRMAEEEGVRLSALRDEAMLPENELAELNRAYEDAHRAATNSMDRATLREANKRRREALEQAKDIVDSEPVYQAAAAIRKHPDPEFRGISYEHLVQHYSKQTADEIRRKFPGVVNTKKGKGLGADVLADGLGYESGDALVYALADADSRGNRISDLAEQIMREHDELTLPDQAVAASESYGRYLEKFHAALSRTIRKVTFSPREYLRNNAKDYAGTLPVREATRYDTHQHTMRQQMDVRMEAAKSGDIRAEMMALEKLRLAHEMAGEAVRAREEVESASRRIQAAGASKNIQSGFRDAILSLAERFEFGTNRKPRSPEHMPNMKDLLGELADYGWQVDFPDWLMNGNFSTNYKDLSMYEFRKLDNLVRHLEKRGREEKRESREEFARKVKADAEEAAAAARGLKGKKVHMRGGAMRLATNLSRPFFAFMDSLQFIFRSADGYSNVGAQGKAGPNERNLWNRLVDAGDNKSVLGAELRESIAPHLAQLQRSAREWERKHGTHLRMDGVAVPELFRRDGKQWSADAVIGMALHMGSNSNRERLHAGYRDLTPQTRDALLGLLSEKDWDAVQGIWDTYESLWERLDAVHHRINGFHMEKVQAREFMPVALEQRGIVKKYRGGYAPALYDPSMSSFMREVTEADSLFSSTEAMHQTPSARSGMTKARKEKAPGLPLWLSADTISKHLNDVATYITMAEAVRYVDKVTRSRVYEEAVTHGLGKDVYEQIRPNLKGMVRAEPIKGWSVLVEKARPFATSAYLALNLRTMIRQFQSAPRAFFDMEARDVMNGIYQTMKNPIEMTRRIREMSPYMADRAVMFDRELAQMVNRLRGKTVEFMGREYAWEDVVNVGFLPISLADAMVTIPMWKGKFEAEMRKNGGDAKAAVKAADDAVRSSQPTFRPEDMSGFLRSGNGIYRLFSMFTTDTVGRYGQRQRYHYRAWREGKLSHGEYLRYNILEAVIPSLGFYMLEQMFWHGSPVPDSDDEKGWKKFIADNTNDIFLQGIPLLNNFLLPGRHTGDSPVFSLPDKMKKLGGDIASGAFELADDMSDEEAQAKMAMALLDLLSIAGKVPVSKVVHRALRGHEQYAEDDDATPFVYFMPKPK